MSVPFGTVPGMMALHLRITEILGHGWDLARATRRPAPFDDAVVEQELQFSLQALTQLPSERTPFAAPTEAPRPPPRSTDWPRFSAATSPPSTEQPAQPADPSVTASGNPTQPGWLAVTTLQRNPGDGVRHVRTSVMRR